MQTTAIPFGMKGHKMVSVDQVDSGRACGCVCPQCKSKLIARKGMKNVWHFAHDNLIDCEGALETSLHLMAKDILSKAERFMIPKVEIKSPKTKKLTTIRESHIIKIDRVIVEKKLNDIQPDLIIESKRRKLLVEIYVSHKTGPEKIDKLKRYGYACLEVDCRKWREINSVQKFTDFLLNQTKEKTWIYNRHKDKALEELIRREKAYEERRKKLADRRASDERRRISAKKTPFNQRPKKLLDIPNDHPLLKEYLPLEDECPKLTDEKQAIIQGINPVECRNCGALTTDWSILYQSSWTCLCKSCLHKA